MLIWTINNAINFFGNCFVTYSFYKIKEETWQTIIVLILVE